MIFLIGNLSLQNRAFLSSAVKRATDITIYGIQGNLWVISSQEQVIDLSSAVLQLLGLSLEGLGMDVL